MSSIQPKSYAPCNPHRVAFLGLGVMGFPMAGHLQQAGHQVTVYNRTPAKASQWVLEFGGTLAATPREAAQGADIVFCCVGNDDDLRSVVLGDDGAFAGMPANAVFVDHTTASAQVARELDAAARARGLHFVDAPVSGGQAGAQNGLLTVMCGGAEADYARVAPVMDAFARACSRMGEAGAGQHDTPRNPEEQAAFDRLRLLEEPVWIELDDADAALRLACADHEEAPAEERARNSARFAAMA